MREAVIILGALALLIAVEIVLIRLALRIIERMEKEKKP